MRVLYGQKCDHADLLPAVPSVTTLNFRRPPSVTTFNFSVTLPSCTPQHRAQTSARTTIANFIFDFEKLGTIYNYNAYIIVR